MNAGESFAEHVLGIVEDIPPGRVMTYGAIAAVLGSRGARVVGQVLAHSGGGIPWWRVIRASGEPPRCHEGEALGHYLAEDTPLRHTGSGTPDAGYRIDLRAAAWWPDRAE